MLLPGGRGHPLNMSLSTLPNPFITREGEAPAEPWRRQLGRSLALPLFPYTIIQAISMITTFTIRQ